MNNPLTEITERNKKIYQIKYSSKPHEHLENVSDTININENKIYEISDKMSKIKNNYHNNNENIDDNYQYEPKKKLN